LVSRFDGVKCLQEDDLLSSDGSDASDVKKHGSEDYMKAVLADEFWKCND
jgi:hypothetical protein